MPRIDAAQAAAVEKVFAAAVIEQARPRTEVWVGRDVLERVAGFYSKPLGPPVQIVLEAGQLFVKLSGQKRSEIFPESETKFFSRVVPAQLSFEMEGDEARAVVLHQHRREFLFPRTTEAVARAAAEPIDRKVKAQERPRVAIPLDPVILERYVGQYELATGKPVTVTAEGDRMFIQLAGQKRYKVYAESEREFFWTVVAAQITFLLDEAGKTTGAVLHQSGRNIPLPGWKAMGGEARAA